AMNLGSLVFPRDEAEAWRLWHWGADQGDPRAALILAAQYHRLGPNRDLAEALRWYRVAATADDAEVRAAAEQAIPGLEEIRQSVGPGPAAAVGSPPGEHEETDDRLLAGLVEPPLKS